MDWVKISKHIPDKFKKYRYPLLVLLIGVVLMLFSPSGKNAASPDTQVIIPNETNMFSLETQLTEILSMVDGAGKVKVMLSIASGEETIYQTNTQDSWSTENQSTKEDTVMVTDASRNEGGLVKQVVPPKYLGAVIVCQGADRPAVRLSVIEAVAKLTGLGTDRITVLKMK